jgi:hypothetical protein
MSRECAGRRALGDRLIDVLNRRDRVRAELRRLEARIPPVFDRALSLRLDALHAEQDDIERALTAADEDDA